MLGGQNSGHTVVIKRDGQLGAGQTPILIKPELLQQVQQAISKQQQVRARCRLILAIEILDHDMVQM